MVVPQGRYAKHASQQIWNELRIRLASPTYDLARALRLLPELLGRGDVVTGSGITIQRQLRLSEADITKLVADYRSGLTVMELSRRYGIHRTTVMDHLRRKGVPKQGPKLIREQIAQAKYLRKMGMSFDKIALVLHVTGDTIRSYISGV